MVIKSKTLQYKTALLPIIVWVKNLDSFKFKSKVKASSTCDQMMNIDPQTAIFCYKTKLAMI